MKPFTLLIERTRTESARVVVHAYTRGEAEKLGREKAESDDVIWEDGARDVVVWLEGRR